MAYFQGNVCCNCQYWDGQRKVSSFKDKAEVRSSSDKGSCTCSKSVNTKGKPRAANQVANCNHFEKWDQLK